MQGKSSSTRLTFLVLSSAAAAFSMLQSLVGPVLSTIQHDLRTSQATVTWVLTAWLLSASVATPLMGRIGDMIGKARTLLVALGAIALPRSPDTTADHGSSRSRAVCSGSGWPTPR